MIEWIASSSILVAAVLLLRLIFRDRISKRLQYALWGLVVLRLLFPGSIVESAASVGNLFSSITKTPVAQAASEKITPEAHYALVVQAVLSENQYPPEVYSALPQDRQDAVFQELEPIIRYRQDSYEKAYATAQRLNALWVVGCIVMGLVLLVSNLIFYIKLRKTRKILPVSHSVPVYQTAAVQTPCLFGLIRPCIYLPDADMGEKAFSYILAHEQTHYRHLDHIWSLIRCVCFAVHWYNPLVWIAVKVSRTDSELACDEGTLAKLGDDSREDYGRTLIEISRAEPSVQDYLLTATTMTGGKRSLYQRIQAIAKKPQFILSAVIALLAVSLVIVVCTFTGPNARPTDPSEDGVYVHTSPYPFNTIDYPEDEAPVPLARLMGMLYILDEREGSLVPQLPNGYYYLSYCIENNSHLPTFNNSSCYIPSFTEFYASLEKPDYVYYDTGNGYQRMIRASLTENRFIEYAPDWAAYDDYTMAFFDNLLLEDSHRNNPYYQATGQNFARPENIDLYQQFYTGFLGSDLFDRPLTSEEKAFLAAGAWGELTVMDKSIRFPISFIDRHLQRFFGITFDQTNKMGLYRIMSKDHEESQSDYWQRPRTPPRLITLISVDWEPESERYCITYQCEQEENSEIYRMSLTKGNGVLLISSNVPVE